MLRLYVVRGCDARKGRETEGRIDKGAGQKSCSRTGRRLWSARVFRRSSLDTPSKGKRRNTRALQALRDFRCAGTNVALFCWSNLTEEVRAHTSAATSF